MPLSARVSSSPVWTHLELWQRKSPSARTETTALFTIVSERNRLRHPHWAPKLDNSRTSFIYHLLARLRSYVRSLRNHRILGSMAILGFRVSGLVVGKATSMPRAESARNLADQFLRTAIALGSATSARIGQRRVEFDDALAIRDV